MIGQPKRSPDALRIHPATITRTLSLLKLPNEVQEQVAEGSLAASSAYEISKLKDDDAKRELAQAAETQNLTRKETANLVSQQRHRKSNKRLTTRECFVVSDGWRVTVTANKKGIYEEIELALSEALEEVRHRIKNGVVRY